MSRALLTARLVARWIALWALFLGLAWGMVYLYHTQPPVIVSIILFGALTILFLLIMLMLRKHPRNTS